MENKTFLILVLASLILIASVGNVSASYVSSYSNCYFKNGGNYGDSMISNKYSSYEDYAKEASAKRDYYNSIGSFRGSQTNYLKSYQDYQENPPSYSPTYYPGSFSGGYGYYGYGDYYGGYGYYGDYYGGYNPYSNYYPSSYSYGDYYTGYGGGYDYSDYSYSTSYTTSYTDSYSTTDYWW